MINKKYVNIYRIKHYNLNDEGELVEADSVTDAIDKFNQYYSSDYDIFPDGITDVILEYKFEVICDE